MASLLEKLTYAVKWPLCEKPNRATDEVVSQNEKMTYAVECGVASQNEK